MIEVTAMWLTHGSNDMTPRKDGGHHISAVRFSWCDQQPMSICREGVTLTVPRFDSGMR